MTTIAVAGKGGTGKTTFAGFLLKHLVSAEETPILAIDCDPNTNLHEVLGLEIEDTVGNIREKALSESIPHGMGKQEFMNYKIQRSIVESEGLDLVAMGLPEGPGCYCFANSVIRGCIEELTGQYRHTVIDNEAGMEHLSRRTAGTCDILFIISDPSLRGIKAGIKIKNLSERLDLTFGGVFLVVNRARNALQREAKTLIDEEGISFLGNIPEDKKMREADERGIPIAETHSSAKKAFEKLMEKITRIP